MDQAPFFLLLCLQFIFLIVIFVLLIGMETQINSFAFQNFQSSSYRSLVITSMLLIGVTFLLVILMILLLLLSKITLTIPLFIISILLLSTAVVVTVAWFWVGPYNSNARGAWNQGKVNQLDQISNNRIGFSLAALILAFGLSLITAIIYLYKIKIDVL